MSSARNKLLSIVAAGLFVLAAGVTLAIVGLLGWGALDLDFGDDELMTGGFVLGAVLGLLGARVASQRPNLHRVMVGMGILLVVGGLVGAVVSFLPTKPSVGDAEMYAGLGRALAARFALGVAVLGATWLLAGWTGLRAARSSA